MFVATNDYNKQAQQLSDSEGVQLGPRATLAPMIAEPTYKLNAR